MYTLFCCPRFYFRCTAGAQQSVCLIFPALLNTPIPSTHSYMVFDIKKCIQLKNPTSYLFQHSPLPPTSVYLISTNFPTHASNLIYSTPTYSGPVST